MMNLRENEIKKAKNAQIYGIILGTLGR